MRWMILFLALSMVFTIGLVSAESEIVFNSSDMEAIYLSGGNQATVMGAVVPYNTGTFMLFASFIAAIGVTVIVWYRKRSGSFW